MLLGAILIGASLMVTACGSSQQPSSGSQTQPSSNRGESPDASQIEVTVYRGNQDASAVVKEKAKVSKVEDTEKKMLVLFGLLKEKGKDTVPSVPEKVSLNSVKLAGGVLTLDVSQNVQSMSSAEELMFVEALPSTVFDNFPEVTTVKFTIDGKPAEALSQTDVSKGISRP